MDSQNPATVLRKRLEQLYGPDQRAPDWELQWAQLEDYCEQPVRYSTTGKEVLLMGQHIADAKDERTASDIAEALNQLPVLAYVQDLGQRLDRFMEVLADEGEEAPPLDDLACPRCSNYSLEQMGTDLVGCTNPHCGPAGQWRGTMDEAVAANK